MKKYIYLLIVIASFTKHSNSQDFNLTLGSHLTYSGGQTCANIWGYVDSLGNEYALVGASNGLSIVNVTNPAAVFQVAQIPVANPGNQNNLWREVETYGKYAYVTTEAGGGLQIVDLSKLPGTTLPYVYWKPTINSQVLNSIHSLHVDSARGKVYLYGSNIGNQGAIIADVSTTPMAPVFLGYYGSRYIHDGYVRGDTLYACHIYDGDCEIVNLTNPAAGVTLADFQTPNLFTHNSWLSKDSKTVFTTDETTNSFLTAYDISNLNNIKELDRIQSNPGSNRYVHNTQIIEKNGGEYSVTSWYTDGVVIVDVTRPSNMVEVGHYDTSPADSSAQENSDWGVFPYLPSGTIVASDIENGLFVLSPTYARATYLEGVVKDCSSNLPISGVQVQIQSPPSYNINSATDLTDGLGQYGVGVAVANTYTVTFSKQAYVSQTFTVSLTSGNVTTLNVSLCTQNPTFSFSGNVFNTATTNGVNGALIHFQDSSIVIDTVTDANGNFTIPNMISGTYDIIVGQWGYITKCFSGTNINTIASTYTVGLDPGIYDDFSFDYGWNVSGACTNSWVRCVPIGTIDNTNNNAVANPDIDDQTDCSNQCFVTDNGGGTAYDHDVDPPGYTILTSPVFDPSAYSVPAISYSRWYYDAALNGNPPNDTMNVYISNGSTTVLLERMLKNTPGNGTWVHKRFKIADFITPTSTMQISISTSDAPPGGTIVEGGFDKFSVYDSSNVAVNNISDMNANVKVYPNPFGKTTTLEITGNQSSAINYELKMYDVYGREVMRMPITDRLTQINRGNLAGGMYFYRINFQGKEFSSGKLLIEE